MKSRFPFAPSGWLGRRVRDLLSELLNKCVVPSAMQPLQRRLSVAADVTPVHQVRSKFHQSAQYPCIRRDSGSCAMLQRSFQCSGLTSNESNRTYDDPTGLAFSHWRPVWKSLASFLACLSDFPCQRFNRWLVVTSERDTVVSQLINELRRSPCAPRELRSLSRIPQGTPALPIPSLQGIHSPLTRAALPPSHLTRLIFCALRPLLVPPHRTCTLVCTVDVWSCAPGVPWQLVGLGHGCFSPARSRHRIPSP